MSIYVVKDVSDNALDQESFLMEQFLVEKHILPLQGRWYCQHTVLCISWMVPKVKNCKMNIILVYDAAVLVIFTGGW